MPKIQGEKATMKTTTVLSLVFTIALGLYVFVPGLSWQGARQVTRAQQNPLPPAKGNVAHER
jgi:hypothetical protein